jgi:hypothetical protein
MRAFSVHGDELQLGLADVETELRPAVEELGFARAGAVYVRRFPGNAQYAARAAERFELTAERMVAQAARLEAAAWESTLEALCERAGGIEWSLVGSAARALRGQDVAPRDVDIVAAVGASEALAAAVADLLVEPLVEDGWLGERWFRAFGDARLECVGGIHEPVATSVEPLIWRGHRLQVGIA